MLTFKPKYAAGFTIVELLVAIIVIAILSGIVYVSYEGYEKNAQGTQVATTVSSYKNAIDTGLTFETDTTPSESYWNDGDFLAACVTSNSERCCFYYHLWQQVMCYNNSEIKADDLLVSDTAYNSIQKYVSDKKAQLPNFNNYGGTLAKCTAKSYGSDQPTFAPPCYTNQIAYVTGLLTTNGKGYLQYYLPAKYDTCFADNVMSYVSGFPERTGAKYTYRQTTGNNQYTFCIIDLDNDE